MNKLSDIFTDQDLTEVDPAPIFVSAFDVNNAPSRTIYQERVNGEWVEIKQYETSKKLSSR